MFVKKQNLKKQKCYRLLLFFIYKWLKPGYKFDHDLLLAALTHGLLQLQQSFDGGGGRLRFSSWDLLVDDGRTGLHRYFLFGPILLSGGHYVHYRLRLWGMMGTDFRTRINTIECVYANLSSAAHPGRLHPLGWCSPSSCLAPPSRDPPSLCFGPDSHQWSGSPAAVSLWPAASSVHSPLWPEKPVWVWWEPGEKSKTVTWSSSMLHSRET